VKETTHINTSLFVLSKVIKMLADNKQSHIPFRESKLTQLIKNSLGGNAMTSVICTISPNLSHLHFTLQTIEFAKRVKNITNKVKINEMIDDHDLIQKYQNRIISLEKQCAELERQLAEANGSLHSQEGKTRQLQEF